MKPNKKKTKTDNDTRLIKAENIALRKKNKELSSQVAKLSQLIDTLIISWREADANLADACWETTKKVSACLEKFDMKVKNK
jgi:hypothetical protein